jgi:asparagine synthase (glutamine-hydrolysing)
MCGIAGFLLPEAGSKPALEARVRAMNQAIAHRGPDGDGIWIDGDAGIALAQRRLAIIDLSPTGAQPMMSASGRFVITYNGEIYNYRELRQELEAIGVVLRGTSDTEVLLEAWECFGQSKILRRLNGMFALAVWDRKERSLTLARDGFGIKPLYVLEQDSGVFFGSELKALRADRDCPRDMDKAAVTAYLRHGYVPAPWTILKGVRKLLPGTMLTIKVGQASRTERYWSPQTSVRVSRADVDNTSEDQLITEGEALITDAVRRQMMADVPLGAFLSGGVDSSLVAALMQRETGRKVDTFTIGFAEQRWDESPHAEAVAAHLGTRHHTLRTSGREALDLVNDIAGIYDEPFADSSQLPTLLLSRLVRNHVTVALSGDGGDETFGGYQRYGWGLNLDKASAVPAPLRQIGAAAAGAIPTALLNRVLGGSGRMHAGHKAQRLAAIAAKSDVYERYRGLLSLTLQPEMLVQNAEEYDPSEGLMDDDWRSIADPLQRMQVIDAQSYMPDDILVKVDRASMSVGLEVRVPLLDTRIWEWAAALPRHMRIREGRGKHCLRAILDRHVPRQLIDRPKQGFAVPMADWLRTDLRDWAESLLSPGHLAQSGLWQEKAVAGLWQAHLSGTHDHAPVLWAILCLERWRKIFMYEFSPQ